MKRLLVTLLMFFVVCILITPTVDGMVLVVVALGVKKVTGNTLIIIISVIEYRIGRRSFVDILV